MKQFRKPGKREEEPGHGDPERLREYTLLHMNGFLAESVACGSESYYDVCRAVVDGDDWVGEGSYGGPIDCYSILGPLVTADAIQGENGVLQHLVIPCSPPSEEPPKFDGFGSLWRRRFRILGGVEVSPRHTIWLAEPPDPSRIVATYEHGIVAGYEYDSGAGVLLFEEADSPFRRAIQEFAYSWDWHLELSQYPTLSQFTDEGSSEELYYEDVLTDLDAVRSAVGDFDPDPANHEAALKSVYDRLSYMDKRLL